jgi:sterol 3beta-glucosyltransferase
VIAPPLPDWPESVHVTGYWTLDVQDQLAKFEPSAELCAFLEAGEPPVYLGWGSMVAGTSEQISRFAVEAAMGAGVRAVVLGGWAALSLDSLPAGPLREYAAANVLFYTGSLPHEWLFPRCAAAVHHGGAGTVAAVLRCGIPNIVTPVFIDQFYWARRVQALRVGVGFSEPLASLDAPALAAAIKECVTSAEIKATAKTLGKQLNDERPPGAETAADVVAEVARQRMLALAAAARTEDTRPPTPASLKGGHSLGKRGAFGFV